MFIKLRQLGCCVLGKWIAIMWRASGSFYFDVFRLFCHGLMLAIFLGFMGRAFPVGDSLAVFRIEFTVLLAFAGAIAFMLGRTLIPMTAMMTVLVSAASVAPYWGKGSHFEPHFTLHQHNVFFANKNLDRLISKVRAIGADVITFQEVGERNFESLKAGLLDAYPHFQACLYAGGGVAVMARDIGDLLDYGCVEKGRLAWMRLDTPQGPVTFASIHQLWPWPMGQYYQRPIFEKDLKALPRPIVIAGDFNNVPWSGAVKSSARAADGKLARGLTRSFEFSTPWPMFRIDHVIVPLEADVRAELTPLWGSDHRGVTARIRLKTN